MTDRHQQKPYPLRMPDELRKRIEEAAAGENRSLHAEILGRLESTFERGGFIPDHLQAEVEAFARRHRLPVETAIERMLYLASASGGQLIVVRPFPGMTLSEMRDMWEAARGWTDPQASIVYDSTASLTKSERDAAAAKKLGPRETATFETGADGSLRVSGDAGVISTVLVNMGIPFTTNGQGAFRVPADFAQAVRARLATAWWRTPRNPPDPGSTGPAEWKGGLGGLEIIEDDGPDAFRPAEVEPQQPAANDRAKLGALKSRVPVKRKTK